MNKIFQVEKFSVITENTFFSSRKNDCRGYYSQKRGFQSYKNR